MHQVRGEAPEARPVHSFVVRADGTLPSRRSTRWYMSSDGYDGGPQLGVRGEGAVIAVAVHARGRDEASESLQKLERGEAKLGTTVLRRPGEPIDEAALARG